MAHTMKHAHGGGRGRGRALLINSGLSQLQLDSHINYSEEALGIEECKDEGHSQRKKYASILKPR